MSTGKGVAESHGKCLDCGKPYSEFGMDIMLPRSQWLEIHPKENGLLCAQCIVDRVAELPGATVIHAVIEIAVRKHSCRGFVVDKSNKVHGL